MPGFSEHAAAHPGDLAVVDGDRRATYAELDARTDRTAHVFAAAGVAPGDRVAVMLPNSLEYLEAWLAAGKIGAFLAPINWHLSGGEVAHVLTDSQAKVVIARSDLAERVDPPAGCRLLVVGDGGDRGYHAAVDSIAGEVAHREAPTLATPMLYTSGTTGRPKGVVHGYLASDEAIRIGMDGQVQLWGWKRGDVYLLSGPAYHGAPGGWCMTCLYAGATLIVLPDWDARAWLRLVEQHRVTLTFLAPAHFIRILEVPADERARYDGSSLRLVAHSGAPCPIPVKRRFMEAFPKAEVWEFYGMVEGGATRISPEEWRERPGSVGKPWPDVEVRVLDEEGRTLPTGDDGLVYVRPAGGVRFHYHEDAEKTERSWRDDAFTVGDVGHLDDDGYLYLTDRAADLVIRDGVNVYPREIEEALHGHPSVVDCAVFGVPDARHGEELMAVVEAREAVDVDDLRGFVADRLAPFKVPRYVEFVAELPRDPNGKVLKRLLRERHWEGARSAISAE